MDDLAGFIAQYAEAGRERIAFAWNGKHGEAFLDTNQDFRARVVEACLAAPVSASPALLADLFEAEARWSHEAWGTPRHFIELAGLLLARGEEDAVLAFAVNRMASFDSYAATHHIAIAPELAARLVRHTQAALAAAHDGRERSALEAALELFSRLAAGTAAQGWVSVPAGTEVSGIRVVRPRWFRRLWARLAALWRRNRA